MEFYFIKIHINFIIFLFLLIENLNNCKNLSYADKKGLNENSFGYCNSSELLNNKMNSDMEYMYKKNYDPKSNYLSKETYNIYNNQKNIEYYRNENEMEEDENLKRKRNMKYQCKKLKNIKNLKFISND